MFHFTATEANIFRRIFEMIWNPTFLFFCCILLLAGYIWLKQSAFFIRIVAFLTVFLLFLLSTPFLSEYCITHLQAPYHMVDEVNPEVRWIVVLGGGSNEIEHIPPAETLSLGSLKRVLEGIRLKQALPHATLLFSGGPALPDAKRSIGELMHDFAEFINAQRMEDKIESVALNTAEEVTQIKSMIGSSPFYLVTSALHMRRSLLLFEHAGMSPIPAPCDYIYFEDKKPLFIYIPNAYNMAYLNRAWHEILGSVWAKIRGLG